LQSKKTQSLKDTAGVLLMIPMLFFGIVGGVISAVVSLPYGFLAALLAYVVGGSVCALIPGILMVRAEARAEARRQSAARMNASQVAEES
jgi:hypothetical protein